MKRTFKLLPFYLFALLLLGSCTPSSTTEEKAPEAFRVSTAGREASCPFLTKDEKGNPVLCWVQATEAAENYLLHYAVSADGGKTFGAPKAIPTTKGVYPHDENLSKLLFKENGDMMAMFAVSNPNPENSYAGLVYYTQSFDGGNTWTAPKQLAENTVNSIDERYFDMALLPDGEIAAVWLDSRKDTPKEGSSLYFARTSGRNGFTGEKAIDRQLCQCCRTDLYVDEQKRLHVAYRGILNDSIRDMMHMVSADNGRNFSGPERISEDNWVIRGCPHTGPTMASNGKGMHYAWYTMGGGRGVFYSWHDGKGFYPKKPVSTAQAAKHPQMTVFDQGRLAIVWDERKSAGSSIGLQIRNETGELLSSTHLTPDSVTAVYPVITPIAARNLLVAYTQKPEKGSEVWYRLVTVAE
ncbi:sialidase family protein [Botryobacter ruber]|uniref:sialidase family protein n=1 Tax=Botryobacter ruber TaxID=2171629 RepID=UPI000E0C1C2A|nr:sialidase family protein [Botryobacter ruber]